MIDVLKIDLYNVRMEENAIHTLVAIELSESNKKPKRSEGALYLALTAAIMAVISVGNYLFAHWQIPRAAVHLPLYALIAVVCIYYYKRHYISFRYTLTDQTLAVERISGKTDATLAAVRLADIESVSEFEQATTGKARVFNASVRTKRESIVVVAPFEEEKAMLFISPSEDFLLKLNTQWQKAVKRERA